MPTRDAIRDLYVGLSGADVVAVQTAFNTRKAAGDQRLTPDGIYGPKTKAAIVSYQKRYGLKPDGIVGFNTRKQLFPNLAATIKLFVRRAFDDAAPIGQVSGGRGLSQNVGASGDPDAIPRFPLDQLFQRQLFPTDPASGDIEDFTLNGVTLPAPGLPDNLFGLTKDQVQLQAGAQFQSRHLFQNQGNSPNPSGAAVITLQQVYARNKDQDGHVELALGTQIVAPFVARTKDGLLWSIQPFVQFTWADIFWHRIDALHLVSPFAQLSAATTFKLGSPVIGFGLFPVNVTVDVTKRISIIGQVGVAGSIDTSNKRVEMGPQAGLFGSLSF
jgi:hypothetical protein